MNEMCIELYTRRLLQKAIMEVSIEINNCDECKTGVANQMRVQSHATTGLKYKSNNNTKYTVQ